jgi:ssDNA-binding Zn-finger/Zn-ribbon topoisomerase 1
MNKKLRTLGAELTSEKMRIGFMSESEIVAYVVTELESELESSERKVTDKVALVKDVGDLVAKHFSKQRIIEASWAEPTDCDRLDWVFSYLEATGVAARQNFGCCGNCNPGETDHLLGSGPKARPYVACFYYGPPHAETVPDSGWLQFEYGTREDKPEDMRRVGLRFMRAALLAGLTPKWSGHHKERIRLQIDWKRRLVSTYKFQPAGTPDPSLANGQLYKALGDWDDDESGIQFSPMPEYVKQALKREEEEAAIAESMTGPIGIPCPCPGCNGELFRFVSTKMRSTYFRCTREKCSFGNVRAAPLLKGGPLGTGRCPNCNFLLGLFSSKYQATVIKCLNSNCTFIQEAAPDDIAVEAYSFSRR